MLANIVKNKKGSAMKFIHFKYYLLFLILSLSLDARTKRKRSKLKHDCIDVALDVPQDFGKTHFILGLPQAELINCSSKKNDSACDESYGLICDGKIKQAFFSPDDSVLKVLLYLINQEKKSIRLAAFSFTDGEVAQALVQAMDRGVIIEIVVDPGCLQDKFGKIASLQKKGLDIFVYDPEYNAHNKGLITSIMHNKFILFESNVLDKSLLWTGSFNFTKSAHIRNQENVIVLDDSMLIDKYKTQFERLKSRGHAKKKKNAIISKLNKKGTVFEDFDYETVGRIA
jgi:cardiolipin hydrolase